MSWMNLMSYSSLSKVKLHLVTRFKNKKDIVSNIQTILLLVPSELHLTCEQLLFTPVFPRLKDSL